jgi:hypothetical protein
MNIYYTCGDQNYLKKVLGDPCSVKGWQKYHPHPITYIGIGDLGSNPVRVYGFSGNNKWNVFCLI